MDNKRLAYTLYRRQLQAKPEATRLEIAERLFQLGDLDMARVWLKDLQVLLEDKPERLPADERQQISTSMENLFEKIG